VGVLLRFGTLDLQSYWSDEAATVDLVKRSLGQMLATIPKTERTPPAYYVLAWLWSHVFGTGEVALRSLSAMFGTLTIICAYAITRRIAGEGAALIAAALTAVCPILVWYSQEARSYAMLTCLSAASVWLWLRAKDDPSKRPIIAWTAVSCLAIATHYFASFIVLFEAISLLQTRRSRTLLVGVAVLAAVQVALIPLAIHQAHTQQGADYISTTPLSSRLVQVPERFVFGEHWTHDERDVVGLVVGACVLITAWLLSRRLRSPTRDRVWPIAGIAVAAIALPLGLALTGLDFFAPRNLLAVWVLAIIVGGISLADSSGWLAPAATAGLLAAFATMTIATNLDPSLQRADWRFTPRALGHPRWSRLIAVGPSFEDGVLEIYVPSAHAAHEPRPAGSRGRPRRLPPAPGTPTATGWLRLPVGQPGRPSEPHVRTVHRPSTNAREHHATTSAT
jgi:uncharacterized membrane protein